MKFTDKDEAEAFIHTISKQDYKITDAVETDGLYVVKYKKIKTGMSIKHAPVFPFVLHILLIPVKTLKKLDEFLIQLTCCGMMENTDMLDMVPFFLGGIYMVIVWSYTFDTSYLLLFVVLYSLRLWFIKWSQDYHTNKPVVTWRQETTT